MHRRSAVWLRHAFKKIEAMETTTMPNSDSVEIRLALTGDRVTDAFLYFEKGGEMVAMAPITLSDIKRMKSDLVFAKKMKSGSAQSIHEQHR